MPNAELNLQLIKIEAALVATCRGRLIAKSHCMNLSSEPRLIDRQPYLFRERWLAKFGHADKWKICLRAARVPRIRSDNGKTSTSDQRWCTWLPLG